MVEQDTIRLLRECDAGIKMGISAIDEVMDCVSADNLKKCLNDCRNEHEKLKRKYGHCWTNIRTKARSLIQSQKACPG